MTKFIPVKKDLISFIFLVLSVISLTHGQSKPSSSTIISIAEDIQKFEMSLHDYFSHAEIPPELDIEFQAKSLTGKNKDEGIAMIPLQAGMSYTKLAFLLYKDEVGNWVYGDWFGYASSGIDFIDIDGDGIYEILCTDTFFNQGIMEGNHQLISIKNGQEKTLYKSAIYDLSGSPFSKKIGDTISVDVKIGFKEVSNTKQLELIEKKVIGKLISYNEEKDETKLDYTQKTVRYSLKNEKYVP